MLGWLKDHPRLLTWAYQVVDKLFTRLDGLIARLGYRRVERWVRPAEDLSKKLIFDCRMCGQCILHSTGMTCPMTCPKTLRNGPCGGVRPDGNCEVIPEMRCIWVDAYERSRRMPVYGDDLLLLQPPVDRRLEGTSAWINLLTGDDRRMPAGWDVGPAQVKNPPRPAGE